MRVSDYSTYFLVSVGVILAAVGSFYKYSYWWDELYSVVAANLGMGEMFEIYVLPDVHPPLYPILLNLWVGVFGSDERVARFLSFIFALASLVVMWRWAKEELGGIKFKTTIIFFSTCSLFAFYAQETRSYSMMLFLASVVTVLYLQEFHKKSFDRQLVLVLVLTLLSLTHYFGFIYAGLVIVFSLLEVRGDFKKSLLIVFSGISCFVWPLIHFMKGGIGEKSGGGFWIKSEGLQSTIYQLSSGVIPQINGVEKFFSEAYREYAIALVFISLLAVVALFAKKGAEKERYRIWVKCLSLLVGFSVVIAVIDSHSPISTRRNYIVLLPVFSMLLGLAAQGIKKSGCKYVFALVFVGGLVNLVSTYKSVSSKYSPAQNHVEAARFIEKNISSEYVLYYLAREGPSMSEIHRMMAEFYFENKKGNLIPVLYKDLVALDAPFYVLMQHQKLDLKEVVGSFKKRGVEVDYFTPQNNETVAVLYSK